METTKTVTGKLLERKIRRVQVKIKGVSNLIMHRWPEKAKREMQDKDAHITVKKVARDPQAEYEASVYRLDDGSVAFPVDAFKKSMVRGAKSLGLVMVDMRTGFFIRGEYSTKDDRELVRITGDLSMRDDMVKLNGKTATHRYRGQVKNWEATLDISYNEGVVSFDHIVNMLDEAGFGVGVGEWRPPTDGTFGRFEVALS